MKRRLYPAALTGIFVALSLGAASARAEDALAVGDLFYGVSSLVGFVILAILVIEWIFLPFAIFGTKDKLNQLIEATNETNKLLEQIVGTDLKPGDEFERRPPSIK